MLSDRARRYRRYSGNILDVKRELTGMATTGIFVICFRGRCGCLPLFNTAIIQETATGHDAGTCKARRY